jgi:hypothetical protein
MLDSHVTIPCTSAPARVLSVQGSSSLFEAAESVDKDRQANSPHALGRTSALIKV